MKKILLGIFMISVLINVWCLIQQIKYKSRVSVKDLYHVKQVDKQTGIENFKDKIEDVNASLYKTKNVFLIHTWDTLTLNFDAQKTYMKTLDSIASNYKNTNIGFVFASQMDRDAIEQYQKNHNFYFKNFICVYDLNEFISSVFIQKHFKFKTRTVQFITNKTGDFQYFKNTLFTNVTEDTLLINNLNNFK